MVSRSVNNKLTTNEAVRDLLCQVILCLCGEEGSHIKGACQDGIKVAAVLIMLKV